MYILQFQANATFEELGDLKMMLEEFVKQGGGLNAITNNTENINTLKVGKREGLASISDATHGGGGCR